MPLKVVRGPEDAPLAPLAGKTVAIIGFGNQGRAHALNLRDSDVGVLVGCRVKSVGDRAAREHGFSPLNIEDAVCSADLIVMALPDEVQPAIFENAIAPNIKPGSTIGFLHGFNIRYGFIKPPAEVGVIMVAPKGPGQTLRDRYEHGNGIPCLFALHQDSPGHDAEALGLAWANGIGCARAGIIYTTFTAETDTDLFGEQTVLCGGMTSLILAAFETLVSAGYPPELAYLECCHEVKQIADLVYTRGLTGMMESISNTAEFGAFTAGPHLVDEHVHARMREILQQIQNGDFARNMQQDHLNGFQWFNEQRAMLKQHPIESAGEFIRTLMPWLSADAAKHSPSSIVNQK